MHAREEILQLYYAGPENVIDLIKELEMKLQKKEEKLKQQEILLSSLKVQVKNLHDNELLSDKLKEQMERIETQLKLLDQK
jgi:hypothetical protein